ncbi:MAG: XdhC family protein [Blastocatellia bacterium]|nr:XdhC family protein [Blastocatellia bacterium]MDW8167510.1 XdhC family protein [Acidobacteriota bacterium]
MKELRDIFQTLDERRAMEGPAALATVVHVEGSAYRREGAKLLLTPEGEMIGSISAGCLEGDVLEWTRHVLVHGEPVLRRYDLTSEDELVWGFGMGCNGKIDVLIEPLPLVRSYLERTRQILEQERGVALATLIEVPENSGLKMGAKRLIPIDGSPAGTLGDVALDAAVERDARALLASGRSKTLTYDPMQLGGHCASWTSAARVFIDCFLPPPQVIIFGAGADAVPLVRLAKEAGFRVTVVDHRSKFVTSERFPWADRLISAHPEEAPEHLTLTPGMFVVLLTHNFHVDAKLLAWLLKSPVGYIGLLGPKERRELLLRNLREQGVELRPEEVQKLYAPVGLDIGAEGPEQIALSIVSEILAVRNRRVGTFLRERQKPIHAE